MGGGSSKYKIAATEQNEDMSCDWITLPSTRIVPIKAEVFTNICPIGKGKFGFVFLAKMNGGSKHVAIKYISKNFIFENQSAVRIAKVIEQ